jgi:DNA-binding winged helix-turn-helix (wHTH) protein
MRYMFDDYILDTQPYELWCIGKHVKLRPKVFEVLAYLIRHHHRVISKDELLEHLWPNQFIGDGPLNACLMAVCRAVGGSGQVQRRIQTFHKPGYRFVAMVEEADHTPLDRATVFTEHPTQEDEAPIQDHAAVAAIPTWAPGADEDSVSHPPLDAQERHTVHALDQEHKQVTVLGYALPRLKRWSASMASMPTPLRCEIVGAAGRDAPEPSLATAGQARGGATATGRGLWLGYGRL